MLSIGEKVGHGQSVHQQKHCCILVHISTAMKLAHIKRLHALKLAFYGDFWRSNRARNHGMPSSSSSSSSSSSRLIVCCLMHCNALVNFTAQQSIHLIIWQKASEKNLWLVEACRRSPCRRGNSTTTMPSSDTWHTVPQQWYWYMSWSSW